MIMSIVVFHMSVVCFETAGRHKGHLLASKDLYVYVFVWFLADCLTVILGSVNLHVVRFGH